MGTLSTCFVPSHASSTSSINGKPRRLSAGGLLNIPSSSQDGTPICCSWKGRPGIFCSVIGCTQPSIKTQASRCFTGNAMFLLRNDAFKNNYKVRCGSNIFYEKNAVLRSFSWLYREGFLLYRRSIYFVVISLGCLVAWHGQEKAKKLVEEKLVPSISSAISEHTQREINLGKVQKISPLSITFESCTVGPHKEEFSCAEVLSLKVRIHPLASLKRRKFVIDAVLFHPIFLVAQKEDYTWLGIPASEGGFQRYLSVEEAIDYRTRIRRIHREEAGARWDRERNVAARNAAERGYTVPETCLQPESGPMNLNSRRSNECVSSSNNDTHRGCQHCTYPAYKHHMEHCSLENSLHSRVPAMSLIFWRNILAWSAKHNAKRDTHMRYLPTLMAASKKVLLERSACMAVHYFHTKINDNNGEYSMLHDRGCGIGNVYNCSVKSKDDFSFPQSEEDNPEQHHAVGNFEATGDCTFPKGKADLEHKQRPLNAQVLRRRILGTGNVGVRFGVVKTPPPVVLESVHLRGGTLMMLVYGDSEPREITGISGHATFLDHYNGFHVHLEGDHKKWRSGASNENGGAVSVNVFVDLIEQKWHADLKLFNLFASLFERLIEVPISWSGGRASGESCSAILLFRGQRIFLHNAGGLFGKIPLEASGDFGFHPHGEFHIMCQVARVEVNTVMRTFKMRPLIFPIAGSLTAVFNCQGPLDAPIFVGSSMISRKMSPDCDTPSTLAYETLNLNKGRGAVAAFDRIPFSFLSSNYTFNTDNCVVDLYGIRACLVDGGEIRGAGNVWMCPEGEDDYSSFDVNFSGSISFDKILSRYVPGHEFLSVNLGYLSGEAKLSGSLLRPKFDIKWAAPKAEGSFSDVQGDIIICHDHILFNSSSVAFELSLKFLTSYLEDEASHAKNLGNNSAEQFTVVGIELDVQMQGFEFFSLLSCFPFDSSKASNLKSSGRIKFHGKVQGQPFFFNTGITGNLIGEITISGLKFNQLLVAPHLVGRLSISDVCIKLHAIGRPDESFLLEIQEPFRSNCEGSFFLCKLLSLSLQKGHLVANACYRPHVFASLEVRQLPLDELELASLRGTVQSAELQLNFQKRRGHGVLSLLRPKFCGVLGESLELAARWSGDVVTVEKTVLEQSYSRYELQGEYVFPGIRDKSATGSERGTLLEKALTGHFGTAISSMGRWRLRLEVPQAEVAEMLPLARLLSRSIDPSVRSRSKDIFIQSLHTVGLCSAHIQDLLGKIRDYRTQPSETILEDMDLPGLADLRGLWHGALDASGGGNGDTLAEFDLHGDDWEWGIYKTQRVLAIGAYSNDDGLHLEKVFIQMDNATIHGDGTLSPSQTNLHFAVLNFPVSLLPMFVQVIGPSAVDKLDPQRKLIASIKGILHMEGDLGGSFTRPECDVQVRLLDGTVGGIDLGRAEIVASVTSSSRFNFNARFEPAIQNGHVHVQGSIPLTLSGNDSVEEEDTDPLRMWMHHHNKERVGESGDETIISEKKSQRERNGGRWDVQLAESLKGLNRNVLDVGEVKVDADIKDGGMSLLTALYPHARWISGGAEVKLQVRGSVEKPIVDGCANFHRASVSSPVLWKPLTGLGGTIDVISNMLCINSLESRVGRRGRLFLRGKIPILENEASTDDQVDITCDVLEVRAKNVLSGQVDTQVQVTGSIVKPNIRGKIQLSHGEVYLPHDKNSGAAASFNRLASDQGTSPPSGDLVASRYVSRFFGTRLAAAEATGELVASQVVANPSLDVISLTDLRLVFGPELRIMYPLILNFSVSGEVELNGMAHPKWIKAKGILTFDNGDVNLVATQVRLKREHLNVAKFEPDSGLDPVVDLALVGSEWELRVRGRASSWQDNLVVTSANGVEQDTLSATEAARVFENRLAESILEGDGQLAFKKLATSTLERLMPRIEGKGEFGQARWRLVYAPQIPSLISMDPTLDPLKSIASCISFGTEVEVHLGKRLQVSIVRQMKESEMAMQWTLSYQLTSRLRVLVQSAPSKRLLFEYSTSSQD